MIEFIEKLNNSGAASETYRTIDVETSYGIPVIVRLEMLSSRKAITYYKGLNLCQKTIDKNRMENDNKIDSIRNKYQ